MDTHVIAPVQNNGRGLSPFWNTCPMTAIRNDPGMGSYQEGNFYSEGILTPTITTRIGVNGWNMFGSSGGTITFSDALDGGWIFSETTDDEGINITKEQHPFRISSNAGPLWFEWRGKISTVATLEHSFFIGLMDSTDTTAIVPITAAHAIADINAVGFFRTEADTTAVDVSYKADGVTAVTVSDGIGTFAADTYIKLGLYFGGTQDPTLYSYINGAKSTATKTIPNATGTDFPADAGLAIVIGYLVGSAASDNTMTSSWVKCFQKAV